MILGETLYFKTGNTLEVFKGKLLAISHVTKYAFLRTDKQDLYLVGFKNIRYNEESFVDHDFIDNGVLILDLALNYTDKTTLLTVVTADNHHLYAKLHEIKEKLLEMYYGQGITQALLYNMKITMEEDIIMLLNEYDHY